MMRLSISRLALFLLVSLALLLCNSLFSQRAWPILANGHSHNDYEQAIPLYDALKYGFSSIEVDVHLYEGILVVSHDEDSLHIKPSITDLYLNPLDSVVSAHHGSVFANDSTQLTLMIDLKENKKLSLMAIHDLLAKYDHLFQQSKGPWKPIIALISGEPPRSTWLGLHSPFLFLDGRLTKNYPDQITRSIRRVSASIEDVISAKRSGEVTFQDLAQIKNFVETAYLKGFPAVRFWGTPDDPKIWQLLHTMKVNIISVNDLQGFASFMKSQEVK